MTKKIRGQTVLAKTTFHELASKSPDIASPSKKKKT